MKTVDMLEKALVALNPRLWDSELNRIWHEHLPDTEKAFRALREWVHDENGPHGVRHK